MKHRPLYLAIAAIVVAVPPGWLAGQSSRVEHASSSSRARLRTMSFRPMSAGFGSRSSERRAARQGRRAHPAPALGRLPSSRSRRARSCACAWAAGAAKRSGRRPEPAAGTAAAPAARRSTAAGRPAPAAAEQPTSVEAVTASRTGSSSPPEDRVAPAARSAGRSVPAAATGGELNGHDGLAVLGSANSATGGTGGTQTTGGTPAGTPPTLGHGDGRLARSRRQRRRRSHQRRRWRWRRALRWRRRRFQPLVQRRPRRRRLGLRARRTVFRSGVGAGDGRATITYDPDSPC